MKRILLLLLVGLFLNSAARSESLRNSGGAVAYSVEGILTIKSASGRTLHVFKTTPPVGTFAISPDGQSIVFALLGPGPMHNGGQLYLLSIATGKVHRLTHTPVYNKWEVYAYPDFSPSGDQVVFAIHSQLGAVPSDGDDAVMDAGPFAVLNLRSGVVKKLSSTENIDGNGPGYGTSPRWSPDGKKLFLNIEDDFFLTNSSGKPLQDISNWTQGSLFALDWLGNECIVSVGGNDWEAAEKEPAKVLLLDMHKTEPLAKLLGVAPAQVTGLIALSPTIRVRKIGDKLIIETHNGTWSVVDPDHYPNVRILSTWTEAQVPSVCR
ncbi:MAG TPA: hypothetical protein VNE63_16605 [Candidatus Acidoferrales bacterium]|nr:hypothetical protein [Candidatus Acidoferrales bacterium]